MYYLWRCFQSCMHSWASWFLQLELSSQSAFYTISCLEQSSNHLYHVFILQLTLRKHAADPEFTELFKEGVALYLSGEWLAAKALLERADLYMREAAPILGGDGPSRTLLAYMGSQNFEAPKSWKGYRPLTSK